MDTFDYQSNIYELSHALIQIAKCKLKNSSTIRLTAYDYYLPALHDIWTNTAHFKRCRDLLIVHPFDAIARYFRKTHRVDLQFITDYDPAEYLSMISWRCIVISEKEKINWRPILSALVIVLLLSWFLMRN